MQYYLYYPVYFSLFMIKVCDKYSATNILFILLFTKMQATYHVDFDDECDHTINKVKTKLQLDASIATIV